MRIVFLINSLSSGGAEHQLVELANGLSKLGYDITISTYTDVPDHYDCDHNIKRLRFAQGRTNLVKVFSMWWFFLTVKTDWVVGFGAGTGVFSILPLLFRSKKKVRSIAGERCVLYTSPSKWKRLLNKLVYHRSDFVVPNSYAQGKQILEDYPVMGKKVFTITNYTDLNVFNFSLLPDGEILRIGIFARYDEQKNCLRFVEAINQVVKTAKKKIVIEWYGDQTYKERQINSYYLKMKVKVEEYHLENYILLKDKIKNVSNAMLNFDAFCLPSLYEGFSNSLSEAICCGRPCLVSDVSDNGVMVKEGINGFLFDPLNVENMRDAFLKFLALNSKERQEMGNASRKRAESLFDKSKFIEAYDNLFKSRILK